MTVGNTHVLPVADMVAHLERQDCLCGPSILPGRVVVHVAWDGRDFLGRARDRWQGRN